MKTKKKSLLALILVLVMVLLSGCGGWSTDDAKAYTQALLDAQYKGEFKDYMKLTDSTEKEAQKMYESSLDDELAALGIDESTLSAEMIENYRNLCLDMKKNVDYKVGKAKEAEDDSFTVDVKVKPLIFEDKSDEIVNMVQEEYANLAEVPSEEEVMAMFYGKLYEVLSDKVANPSYGEEKSVTLHVKKNKDGVYYIPDEELETLSESAIAAE